MTQSNVKKSEGVPHCSCGGEIKPDVVLYEEGLDAKTMDGARPGNRFSRYTDHRRHIAGCISGSRVY